MTMVASGQIDLGGTATVGGFNQSIQQEYTYGTNLNAYRGKLYTNAAATTASPFPNTSNPISMNAFYSTRKIPSGSVTYSSGSSTVAVPPYNTITISITAAGGGGGGGGGGSGGGGCPGDGGSNGNNGNTSSLSVSGWNSFTALAGGAGGGGNSNTGPSAGTPGTDYGGGNGGAAGTAGGGGGKAGGAGGGGQILSYNFSNPLLGGGGPTSGGNPFNYSVGVYVSSGAGQGGDGGAGRNADAFGRCYNDGGVYGGSGGNGGNGVITISWS